MDANEIRNINSSYAKALEELGVKFLCHANSVKTSVMYLEQGGLLSREAVENASHLEQTAQYSDETDKQLGIYGDIFLDPADLAYHSGVNFYGPVLFCYRIGILYKVTVPVRVTRQNPVKAGGGWSVQTPDSERYFSSADEFKKAYNDDIFGHSFTFTMSKLPFEDLAFIKIDNPHRDDEVFKVACKRLETLAARHGAKVIVREDHMFKQPASIRFQKNQSHYQDLHEDDFTKFFGL